MSKRFYYTAAETAKAMGVTLRMLQWWDEQNIFKPSGGIRKHTRLYSVDQLLAIGRLRELREAGVPLRTAREILNWKYAKVRAITGPVLMGDTVVVPR